VGRFIVLVYPASFEFSWYVTYTVYVK